jgi:hypothetical protein
VEAMRAYLYFRQIMLVAGGAMLVSCIVRIVRRRRQAGIRVSSVSCAHSNRQP